MSMTHRLPPQIRLARPSGNLEAIAAFYSGALGLRILASFQDHAGIDGIILGHLHWPYHLEFTRRLRDPVIPARSDEDLLVFYLPDRTGWNSAVERLRTFGAREVVNANPYWRERGLTFEDPDGNLVVLENASWP
jgi:catechol 2,3-dioxygenase-like lactoylglutathione lyase family enzyme